MVDGAAPQPLLPDVGPIVLSQSVPCNEVALAQKCAQRPLTLCIEGGSIAGKLFLLLSDTSVLPKVSALALRNPIKMCLPVQASATMLLSSRMNSARLLHEPGPHAAG
jgi:hypothetical protein